MKNYLSTEDGHILVCLLLILLAWGMHVNGWNKAEEVLMFSLGVLARCLGSKIKDAQQG